MSLFTVGGVALERGGRSQENVDLITLGQEGGEGAPCSLITGNGFLLLTSTFGFEGGVPHEAAGVRLQSEGRPRTVYEMVGEEKGRLSCIGRAGW